ncbi:MAG: DUF4845 domain-containing protein [Methylococcales bacterium]
MKHYRSKSEGLTLITIVIILLVVAFFTLLVLKIGPIYYDNSLVKSSIAGLKSEPNLMSMSKREITTSLEKRFDVSYVKDVTANDVLVTKRGKGYLKVALEYEIVENVAGNLDVLVTFNEGFEVGDR